jgi:putative membrane protein
VRGVYLAVLASHVVLAAALAPMVLVTLRRALSGRFDAHRRMARRTLPVWLYVAASGWLVYWMLYGLR